MLVTHWQACSSSLVTTKDLWQLCLNTLMRILVTADTNDPAIDSIMWYCWRHEKNEIFFCSGNYIVHDGHYHLWRIHCEPSKYVDYMLMRWAGYLVVY
jgi:hypothetical protein